MGDRGDDTPADLDVGVTPFAIEFHPQSRDLLAVGLVDGAVSIHDLTRAEGAQPAARVAGGRRGSCRVAAWLRPHGERLLSGYESGAVVAWDWSGSGCRRVWESRLAGAASVSLSLSDMQQPSLFACGDDVGSIHVWDARLSGCSGAVLRAKPHEDFVSGLAAHGGCLLACSADGRLSVLDPRRNLARLGLSDPQDDELLSLQVLKAGRKVVCGTQTGAIVIWSWGRWGDSTDRAIGHPESIDAMLKVNEHVMCTGSSDGLLRVRLLARSTSLCVQVVRVQPGLQLLGILGDHDGFPIERLAANNDLTLVASISHDALIRFWDSRELHQLEGGDATNMEAPGASPVDGSPVDRVAAMDTAADDADWETEDGDDDDDAAPSILSMTASRVSPVPSRAEPPFESFFDGL